MKYVPSMAIGQLSRSQGSTTASRNRFGSYMRNRVMPVNPRTDAQTAQRTVIQETSQEWRALTQAQRDAWTALGALIVRNDSLGQSYTLTGLQAYTSINRTRTTFGVARVSDPPTFVAPVALATLAVASLTSAALSLTFTPTPIGASNKLLFEASAPISAGRNFIPRSGLKIISASAANITSPQNLFSAYSAVFGAPIVGSKVFFRVRAANSSYILGTGLETSAIVA